MAEEEKEELRPKDKDVSTRRVFQCSSCNTYYEDWNLFLHMRNVHSRFICLLCLGLFPNANRLARHLLNRHGQTDNHFQSTADMMAWNQHRPCHLMCVSCESVEECVHGQPVRPHTCGQNNTSGAAVGEGGSTVAVLAAAAGKKSSSSSRSSAAKAKRRKNVSSDLEVVTAGSSGFKLKIKGLSSGSHTTQAVNEGEAEQEVGENALNEGPGDDNNNMDSAGYVAAVAAQGTDDEQKVGGGGGAFSFNFILSKKGLVRNPNPSRSKQRPHDDESEPERDVTDGQRHSEEPQSEEGKKEEAVPRLLLKIPKYVPVGSEESEEDEEDEEEDDEYDGEGEEDDEDEGKEDEKLSNETQFRPVKEEAVERADTESGDKEVKEQTAAAVCGAEQGGVAVKEEEDGVAVDRNNLEQGATTTSTLGEGGEVKSEQMMTVEKKGNDRRGRRMTVDQVLSVSFRSFRNRRFRKPPGRDALD